MIPLGLFFFPKVISHVMSLFSSKNNFKSILSGSVKRRHGNFYRDSIESVDHFVLCGLYSKINSSSP